MASILRATSLSRRFGGVQAVEDFTIAVEAGEIRGLIGPNGSGKSTTLNLLSGLLRHDHGEIELAGSRIDHLRPYQRAALGMGRVFQSPTVFGELSVLENVVAGLHSAETRGRSLFDVVFRPARTTRMDHALAERGRQHLDLVGLAHAANARAADLSYGEQKLLDIAKAIAAAPKLLLMDEPAAGLGLSMVSHLVEIIKRLREAGTTVIITDHNLEMMLSLCDKITVLNYGQKLAEGTPAQVRSDETVIAAYIGPKRR